MEEEKQTFEDDSERRGSSWRVEDLLDVESGDLAANLASTNLGEGQVVCPGTLAWGIPSSDETVDLDFNTYDMRYFPTGLCVQESIAATGYPLHTSVAY